MLEINKIYNGDCLEVMKDIEDNSIDCIITDPPYELDNHGGVAKGHNLERKLNRDKHINFLSNGFDINVIFKEFERVIKKVNILIFCSNKQISKVMSWWEERKYSVTLLVWDKPNPISLCNGKHVSNLEFIVYVRGKGATNNLGYNKQFLKTYKYSVPHSKIRLHPTQKSIELVEDLIKLHTEEGDVILDSFIGSGTTAIACINTNRNFIGIELDKEYCDIANKRIDAIKLIR